MRKMRPRKNRAQWSAIIEQQIQSGLSVEAFCEQHDIGMVSFAKWRKRLRDAAAKPLEQKSTQKGFEPVQLIEQAMPGTDVPTTVSLSIGANMTLTIQTSGSVA